MYYKLSYLAKQLEIVYRRPTQDYEKALSYYKLAAQCNL